MRIVEPGASLDSAAAIDLFFLWWDALFLCLFFSIFILQVHHGDGWALGKALASHIMHKVVMVLDVYFGGLRRR